MTTHNNKHIITNETKRIRQLFFSHVTFLSTNGHFLPEQFLIPKYSSILHALLLSQSQLLGFHR